MAPKTRRANRVVDPDPEMEDMEQDEEAEENSRDPNDTNWKYTL